MYGMLSGGSPVEGLRWRESCVCMGSASSVKRQKRCMLCGLRRCAVELG